jgi:hypothetical protein
MTAHASGVCAATGSGPVALAPVDSSRCITGRSPWKAAVHSCSCRSVRCVIQRMTETETESENPKDARTSGATKQPASHRSSLTGWKLPASGHLLSATKPFLRQTRTRKQLAARVVAQPPNGPKHIVVVVRIQRLVEAMLRRPCGRTTEGTMERTAAMLTGAGAPARRRRQR